MAARDDAIGIFDSGVGGLTVVHAILEALPHEDLIYLGDTARYPYGTKSAETVTRYGVENVDFLAARAIKTLVLGCTHYPLLKPVIAEVMGDAVALVDSAEETAREVGALLGTRGLARHDGAGATSFFVTDVPDRFIRIGERFLGARVGSAV